MSFAPANGFLAQPGRCAWLNARLVDPSQHMDVIGGLLVDDGHVVAIGPSVTADSVGVQTKTIDCAGKTIFPGLVDLRVHIGEPGAANRETIASASRAAAAGGVTSMVMMPDTVPVLDNVALVEYVLRTARETAITRVLPSVAITKDFGGTEMTEVGLLHAAGAVMLSESNNTIVHSGVMRRAMTYARDFGVVLSHFSNDLTLAEDGVMNEGLFSAWLGLPGIPREAELLPLERDLRLARLTGARYHAAKISTAMSAAAIDRAKNDGADVTAAVTINHLALNENDIGEYRTFFKLSPPLRHDDDRRAMVDALKDGTIDIVVSAHNPQDVDQKRLPFAEAADGAIGLETLFGVGMRLVHDGSIGLMRLIEVMSTAPADRLGLAAGSLKPGAVADFAIAELDAPWLVKTEALHSQSKNTAFEDARLTGRICETFVAGRCVYTL